jgi:hypothetical protein
MSSQIFLYDIYTKVGFMQLVFHNIYLYKKQTHDYKNAVRYLRLKWAFMQPVFGNTCLYKNQTKEHENMLSHLHQNWALCNQYWLHMSRRNKLRSIKR